MSVDLQRLLRFARELQQATSIDAIVRLTQREIVESTGYSRVWFYVLEPDRERGRMLAFVGDAEELQWEHAQTIVVAGDRMAEEILRGEGPVVVEDARTDPRPNPEIVAKLGNRTIINVPLALIDSPLGAFGTGTFGDEGPRPPTPAELDHLVAMASQISVAVARIRRLEERAVMERERAALQRRVLIAQKMESLGVLAGGVAHDLNNLLMIVLLGAKTIGKGPLGDAQRETLEGVTSAAQRAAALTRKLLDIARPQPEKLDVVDLRLRVRDLAELLGRAFPPEITLELVEGPASLPCLGDAAQLDQVLMNLCVNARDAMPQGGRLRIEATEVALGAAQLEAYPWAKPGRYVLIAVSDTGCGMAPLVAERIFEPFFTTKAPSQGTGLGLAVAYGIVRQHGGLIHVYSEPGLGTTMKVYLPVHDPLVAERPTRLEGPAPLGSERILVADDDPTMRAQVIALLSEAGYSVVTVADGAEAVATAAREDFDLVLLDVVMPKLGGQQAFAQIHARRPHLPCLFATGYAADLLPLGVHLDATIELLHKPYDPAALLHAVRRALDRARR
jgi:two-component system cell cycle sensor histidine kinase/response regulator CckA